MRPVSILFGALLAGLVVVSGCEKREPLRIGFIGGISGRVADLGVAGRNGVQLAIEQRNAAGGINGRPVELVVRDDAQNTETAKQAVKELIDQHIEVIIGPMTSSVAMAILPQINSSGSILLSPTVTTTELSGKDDNFLRVIAPTTDYAVKNARYLHNKLGIRSAAVIYDQGNRSYTESWLNDFRTEFTRLGGRVLLTQPFTSGQNTSLLPVVKELLAVKPDTLVIITNAVDSALICQLVRKLSPGQKIAMSEWASTERFIELAGPAAEGVVVSQFLDRNDQSRRYLDFLAAYRARFKQEPGFAGVAGYDAALVALDAHAAQKKGETIKGTILGRGSYQGVQQPLAIDRHGDANRHTFVTSIRSNQYVTVE